MSTGTSCHFGQLLQVSKKSLWSLILYNFFHDLHVIHVYSSGAETDSPQGTKFWCQQKCLVISFICCKFQKMSSKCFHDLIHVYSPGAGEDSPEETKFWCHRKALPICWKFQRNLFEVWFYTIFFHDFLHVYIPGAGGIQPPGDKVLMSTETSCHCC